MTLPLRKLVACNGVSLNVEQAGKGRPVILVHGTFNDATTWDPVFASLAGYFRVIRYDRRGYGQSQRPGGTPEIHARDLMQLICALGLSSVVLVGNSLGALISMRTSLLLPDRVALVLAQEPPFLELLHIEPTHQAIAARIGKALTAAIAAARAGDSAAAAQIYVEGVTSAPNAWGYLPEAFRQSMIDTAAAFGAEAEPEYWLSQHLHELELISDKFVITQGERSGPYLRIIADQLNACLPRARRHIISGAGHVAHQSCPKAFVRHVVDYTLPLAP